MVPSAVPCITSVRPLTEALDIGRLSTAAQTFVAAIAQRPDLPMQLARMAQAFKNRGAKSDAQQLAKAAHQLAPNDVRVRALTEWLDRREAPLWHFPMLHDEARNEAYAQALRHFVQPGMTVLEFGTGSGLLAMLAAQAGAGHVYTCERYPEVAKTAREIIERNGFGDRITVIHKDARALRLGEDLPERADLFVAELVDDSLLADHVLSLTEYARHELLTPEAIFVPNTVSAVGYLITGKGQSPGYRVGKVMGFDLTPFNRFTPVELTGGLAGRNPYPLSDAVTLAHFDLHLDAPLEASRRIRLTATRAGQAEAVMRWLRLDFGADIFFENRPPQSSHWRPRVHVLPQTYRLEPEEHLDIEVYHTRDRLFLWPA